MLRRLLYGNEKAVLYLTPPKKVITNPQQIGTTIAKTNPQQICTTIAKTNPQQICTTITKTLSAQGSYQQSTDTVFVCIISSMLNLNF